VYKSNYSIGVSTEIEFHFFFVELSGWLLFNANSAIFQLYHGKN